MRTKSRQPEAAKQKNSVARALGVGLVWAVLCSTLLLIGASALLTFTGLPPEAGTVMVYLSGFFGAFHMLRAVGQRGLLLGLLFGLCYIAFICLASFLYTRQLPALSALWQEGLACLLGGMLGGIFGVNRPRKRR